MITSSHIRMRNEAKLWPKWHLRAEFVLLPKNEKPSRNFSISNSPLCFKSHKKKRGKEKMSSLIVFTTPAMGGGQKLLDCELHEKEVCEWSNRKWLSAGESMKYEAELWVLVPEETNSMRRWSQSGGWANSSSSTSLSTFTSYLTSSGSSGSSGGTFSTATTAIHTYLLHPQVTSDISQDSYIHIYIFKEIII